ncbi:MAG: glycosyltransferase [Candidatus Omnitrophica bacterium]|nr:glycosyltransferase [Candidatus Omnitrophota bacterium]
MSPAPACVSVVTPSYNQGQFLEETIRSVLSQEHPRLEYLVIDGGSTDGSVELIQRYANRLAYWVSESDAGQAEAINKGWQRAQGDVLAYLNSDDCYLPGAVRRAAEYLTAHQEVGMVYGACQVVDERNQAVGGTREISDCSLASLLRCPLPQPTMFVRRWVFDRVGWLDPTLHCTMDWDFTLRAAVAGIPLARLPGPPLAAVRVWRGAKTSNLFEQCVEESIRMRTKLLTTPHLPPHLARQILVSKAWSFLWPSYEYYVRGQVRAARRLLHRAVASRPSIIAHPEFLGLYARTLLGRSGSRLARRMKASLLTQGPLRSSKARGWRSRPSIGCESHVRSR